MVWICEIITKMSEYFRLSKYFRKSLVMLPKHLTLIIERRLETTIYKDTMETPWLRNQCATAKQRGSVCHNPDPRFMLFVVKHCIKKISRNKLCYPVHSCNILWLLSCYDEVSSSNVFISRLDLNCLKVSRLSSNRENHTSRQIKLILEYLKFSYKVFIY